MNHIPTTFEQSKGVLGTTVTLRIVANAESDTTPLFARLWQEIELFNARFSRFLPESELSHLNAKAGKHVTISPEFATLLRSTQYYATLTNGIFNPFILPALQQAGYRGSLSSSSLAVLDYSDRSISTPEALEVGEDFARIPEHTAIDLGGIGKGFLADLLSAQLQKHSGDFLLSLGGDMAVHGHDARGPWEVEVAVADESDCIGVYTAPTPGPYGIATSGAVRVVPGRTQPHLIDPRTGRLADNRFDACTVVAECATAADVLASCILIEGVEAAKRYLEMGVIRSVMLFNAQDTEPVILGPGFTTSKIPEHFEYAT